MGRKRGDFWKVVDELETKADGLPRASMREGNLHVTATSRSENVAAVMCTWLL